MADPDSTAPTDLTGLSVTEAAAAVDADPDRDQGRVRAVLEPIAEDGVVTESGVRDALADLRAAVSTAATGVDAAATDHVDVRRAAADVEDVPVVATRLDEFAERRRSVESRVEELDADLQDVLARDVHADTYRLASEMDRIRTDADRLRDEADDLSTDVEAFRRWLDDPSARYEELESETVELARAVDSLETDATILPDEDAVGTGASDGDDADAEAESWFDCAVRRRLLDLRIADLHAEASDVAAIDARRGEGEPERVQEVSARLSDLGERTEATATRIDDVARPAWRARYGDRLRDVDAELERHDPPVDWDAVCSAVDGLR